MLQSTAVALILGFWACLYLADAFLKENQYTSRFYLTFLNQTGLSVSIAQVRWHTACFNRAFIRMGQWRPHWLRVWFSCGVCFGMVAMILSVFLLTLMVVNTLRQKPVEQQVLTPVMPGINLPMSQITYYLGTLLVCGILHEVGHAIAAVREQVRVNGFGLFFLALYPGAYVDLQTEHLQAVSPMRQLRIYCAGVWHNFVIVILALVALGVLPWVLMPMYHTGSAVVITSVQPKSPVSGPRGLHVGDHVTSISGCRVTSMADWVTCIQVSMEEKSNGYCMSLDLVKQQNVAEMSYTTPSGNTECCSNTSSTHLCFAYFAKGKLKQKYACLPARSTSDRQVCHLQSDCYNPKTPSVCVLPSLDNSTKLLRIIQRRKSPLLFLGHPLDLHYSVTLSDYVPSYTIVPVNLPYVLITFCKYLISLSGALAILNVVPCYALDGQFILHSFIELSLRSTIPSRETRGLIFTLLLLFGTLLLATNIIIAMYFLFR